MSKPIKRIVVAGCRDFCDYSVAKEFIDICLSKIRLENDIIVLSGGCRGADMLGERYAKENDFEIERFPADWKTYGRAAGPIRNKQMAEKSDYVICFWDGKSRGTKTMIDYAKQQGKEIRIKHID